MLSLSLDTLLKVSKTTSPLKLFDYDCVTLFAPDIEQIYNFQGYLPPNIFIAESESSVCCRTYYHWVIVAAIISIKPVVLAFIWHLEVDPRGFELVKFSYI